MSDYKQLNILKSNHEASSFIDPTFLVPITGFEVSADTEYQSDPSLSWISCRYGRNWDHSLMIYYPARVSISLIFDWLKGTVHPKIKNAYFSCYLQSYLSVFSSFVVSCLVFQPFCLLANIMGLNGVEELLFYLPELLSNLHKIRDTR